MIELNKIFVCEFITGGGLCAEPLPTTLAREGALMRDALLQDLANLSYEVCTTVDARISSPTHCVYVMVQADEDVWKIWQQQMQGVDAVFLIAPESDNLLHYLTQMAALQDKLILGCGLDAIEITSNKMATYLALKQVGITTIATFTVEHWIKHEALKKNVAWLAKPNDGAGCEATVSFDDAENLMHWLKHNKKQNSHIIQPFQVGTPASISCVMHQGRARVLSCNAQIIEINQHTLSFKGVIVNGMREYWQAFELMANQVASAFLGLAGYVGIDVIVNENTIFVVEINPRLTTSYVGLHEATGQNPAKLIINTLTQPDYQWPNLQQNVVTILA